MELGMHRGLGKAGNKGPMDHSKMGPPAMGGWENGDILVVSNAEFSCVCYYICPSLRQSVSQVSRQSKGSTERVDLDLSGGLAEQHGCLSTGRSHLVHVPYARGSIDVLAQLLAHLFDRLGHADEGASHEVEAFRVVIFGDTVQKRTFPRG